MQFELRNHPAQARHPVHPHDPLVDEKGNPVPLFVDQRAIYMDGKLIGYCNSKPGFPVSLIYQMPEAVTVAARQFVETEVGDVSRVASPPSQQQVDEANRELFEDDDDDSDIEEE